MGFFRLENNSGGFSVKGSESTDHFVERSEGGEKKRKALAEERRRTKRGDETEQRSLQRWQWLDWMDRLSRDRGSHASLLKIHSDENCVFGVLNMFLWHFSDDE